MEFERLLNESMGSFEHKPTEIIEAEVTHVDRHKVIVDVGLHTEGLIPRSEFVEQPVVGDRIRVVVEALDDGDGQLKITHREVMRTEQLERIPDMVSNGEIVDCKVVATARAGLMVQVGYLDGFMPRKQVDVVPVQNHEEFVGQSVRAKILSMDSTHNNLIVSRKMAILDERGGVVPLLEHPVEVGDIIEGKVINIKRFGVFVDIGGISPLLHISDLDWDVLAADTSKLAVGDRLKVIVKHKDADTKRYCLSLKHLNMGKWEEAKAELAVDSQHTAKVVKVEENGDIHVVVGGVSGLIKNKEVSWTRMTTSSINAAFRRGQEIPVKVVGFDETKGFETVLVSHKACVSNPWNDIRKVCKEGDQIDAKVKSVGDKMIFVNIHGDIDAIVHVREISWVNPFEAIQNINVNDTVKVAITSIDIEDRRVVASIKATQENPMQVAKKGSKVKCAVKSIARNGDVQVECTIRGRAHKGVVLSRNAVPSKSYSTSEIYEVGQALEATVINIFPNGVINLNVATNWVKNGNSNNALKDAMLAAKDAA